MITNNEAAVLLECSVNPSKSVCRSTKADKSFKMNSLNLVKWLFTGKFQEPNWKLFNEEKNNRIVIEI